jgi:hypothetical protein
MRHPYRVLFLGAAVLFLAGGTIALDVHQVVPWVALPPPGGPLLDATNHAFEGALGEEFTGQALNGWLASVWLLGFFVAFCSNAVFWAALVVLFAWFVRRRQRAAKGPDRHEPGPAQ